MLFCDGEVSMHCHEAYGANSQPTAIQSVSPAHTDGHTCYWSENHVLEDFDLALRLQTAGDVVRLASYHNDEFKEGVSLTIYDELTRWEKYAALPSFRLLCH